MKHVRQQSVVWRRAKASDFVTHVFVDFSNCRFRSNTGFVFSVFVRQPAAEGLEPANQSLVVHVVEPKAIPDNPNADFVEQVNG
ncbi:unannotated protein [freshwater metagenome]|uniref:Unannotated protein n=1 Tax=freshwater metagenome TaxID=449393 RepID=A0A6J7D725_9ZZZZ